MATILTCSCGQHVGHLRKPYLELIQKFSKEDNKDDKTTPEYKALAELAKSHGFDPENVCCRQMIICTYDSTDLVS